MKPTKRFDCQFSEVVKMIHVARYNAIKNVNSELVRLYWNIGEYISKKLETAEWGDAVVDQLADYIQRKHAEFKGFTRRGLYRMRQFYETYRQKQFVSAVLTQIGWTNHLVILSKTKTKEEREFYLALSVKERYSSRELERQIDSGLFERAVLSRKKVSSIDDFKPEYLGKLNFYLEALDRDVRKPDENPSVGIILCKSKDDEVVEYALSRNLSPAMIAEYKTKLIPKKVLQKKLHEYYLLGEAMTGKEK